MIRRALDRLTDRLDRWLIAALTDLNPTDLSARAARDPGAADSAARAGTPPAGAGRTLDPPAPATSSEASAGGRRAQQ